MKKIPLENLAQVQEKIINKHIGKLLTYFDQKLKKYWSEGQHLIAEKTGLSHRFIIYASMAKFEQLPYLNDGALHEKLNKPLTYILCESECGELILKHYMTGQFKILKDDSYSDKIGKVHNCRLEVLKDNLVTQCLEESRKKANQNSAAQSKRASNSRWGVPVLLNLIMQTGLQ